MASSNDRSSRFMLWIDGVGGFLVCEGRTVTLGQPGDGVEVPLMADISRKHATITRDGEHYVLEPRRPCLLNGRPIAAATRIGSPAELALGADPASAVRLRFCVPHACGMSARLDLADGRRLRPHADGVVLLADACVVGPAATCHVQAPRLTRLLVLFRRPDGTIVFRTSGSYDVDGRRSAETTVVGRSSRIAADDFVWQLEPLE